MTILNNIHSNLVNRAILFILCSFLLITPIEVVAAYQAYGTSNDSLVIVHMTDPQLGFRTKNVDFKHESVNFEKAMITTNKLKPDAVVITGDLINRPDDQNQITEFKRIIGLLDTSIPLYMMPGNHDLGDDFNHQILYNYRKNFGKDYYTFTAKNRFCLVLNSQMIASGSNVRQEYDKQYRWMLKNLKKAKRGGYQQIFVFQHHPFFVDNVNEKDAYFNIPIQVRKQYLELFKSCGVNLVLSGHLHYNLQKMHQGIQLITSGPIANAFHDENPGVSVLKVYGSDIQHQFYSLGAYEKLAQ